MRMTYSLGEDGQVPEYLQPIIELGQSWTDSFNLTYRSVSE